METSNPVFLYKGNKKAYMHAYYLANKEKILKQNKENLHKYKEYRTTATKLNAKRKRIYGITSEDFESMAASQGYACAICKMVSTRTLHIDHDHKTNKVRGLLCYQCNIGIGCLKENAEFLSNAIKYLT